MEKTELDNTRRRFLQLSAGLAAVTASTAAPAAPSLPTVRIGQHEITRMIIGSNPFYGYSHASSNLDQHMRDWATPDNVLAALKEAEKNGITTFRPMATIARCPMSRSIMRRAAN
jgi:hypothetical protein